MNTLKKYYSQLEGKKRTRFRLEVSAKCGWGGEKTFYRKLNGITDLKPVDEEAIVKIFNRIK